MGTWLYSQGRWRMQGAATRTVLIATDTFTGTRSFPLLLADREHKVRLVIFSSRDGRTCYEVGIDPDDTSKVLVQKVVFGGSPSVVPTTNVSHGVDAGTPFEMDIRVVEGTIAVHINGDPTPLFIYTVPDATPDLRRYRHYGLVSDVPGAVVLRFKACDLVQDTLPRQDVLLVVANGHLWWSTVEGERSMLAAGVFNPTGPVSMATYGQRVYAVDGRHAVKIDLSVEPPTVGPWTPHSGQLPGQTVPGTTTATQVFNFLVRIGLTGVPESDQDLFFGAVDDPEDFDYGADTEGRAFATSVSLPGRIGDTITGVCEATKGVLIVGCRNSIWRFVGDPALGVPNIDPILRTTGLSGPHSAVLVSEGLVLAHCFDGVYLIPTLGEPIPLSDPLISEGLHIRREDGHKYLVQVRFDPRRRKVWIFLTKTPQAPSLFWCYEARRGGFRPGQGYFFPQDWPSFLGPTASIIFKGRLLMGTYNGLVGEFGDDAVTDHGVPIHTMLSGALLVPQNRTHDVILSRVVVMLACRSAPVTVKVFGGRTPQEAYSTKNARLLCAGMADPNKPTRPLARKVRSPAIVIDLTAPSGRVIIEDAQVAVQEGRIQTARLRTPIPAPPTPCQPPVNLLSAPPASAAAGGFASGGGASGDPGSAASGTPGSVLSGSGPGSFTSGAAPPASDQPPFESPMVSGAPGQSGTFSGATSGGSTGSTGEVSGDPGLSGGGGSSGGSFVSNVIESEDGVGPIGQDDLASGGGTR